MREAAVHKPGCIADLLGDLAHKYGQWCQCQDCVKDRLPPPPIDRKRAAANDKEEN